jgi:type IV secretion system protein VirB9
MIVDRLFAAAELRFGDKDSEKRVRISRTDGKKNGNLFSRLFGSSAQAAEAPGQNGGQP